MEPPPPPPPPHGANKPGGKAGGLPDGKYDIFVIPPSSSGSGFLYLPSLNTQRNSFLAGVACTAAAFFIWNVTVPVVKDWLYNTMNGGGSGVIVLILGVGVLSWAFGKTQAEGYHPGSGGSGPAPGASGTSTHEQQQYQPPPQTGPQPPPKSSWQRPQANTSAGASGAKTSWEKAREETKKKEDEKRRAEELKKKREELEKEKQKQREKELRERLERELKEKREKEAAEKAAKDKVPSPSKRPPMPTARTEDEDDAYSFRPYDRQKRAHKANSAASMYSESSYAASQTTARTTPPPTTNTGPYNTKDPDKIIIRGVYSFNNAFMRTPVSQLISGKGPVSDGLILRITTEGLFIDDDRRGVPQREWDIKAWTMKLAEVWCPNIPMNVKQSPRKVTNPFAAAASRQSPAPSDSESTAFVSNLNKHCITQCRTAASRHDTVYPDDSASSAGTDETLKQSCEMAGLHVLRASIRDQDGKKYVFILSQSEGWKVAVGLQRLRRGTQVRALGVAGLPQNEAKALLQQLGYV